MRETGTSAKLSISLTRPSVPLTLDALTSPISYCRAFRLAESAACIAARNVSLMRVW